MQIGIMARTFNQLTLEGILDAVVKHGIRSIQFSFGCVGLPELPDRMDESLFKKIRREVEAREINMAAVSGTFNMIHPDVNKRRDGLQRFRILTAACHQIGTSVISLCTGTRDPDSMWRRHPDNDLPGAWDDLIDSMEEVLRMAEENDVILAFEPEVSNVIDSAVKGRRLLDQMKSRHLKVVMDPANIFHKGELPRMREIIDEAFHLLGKDIAIAHAKDLDRDGEAGHIAAGKGLLDYRQYLSLLSKVEMDVPLILHGLGEGEVDGCVEFLRYNTIFSSK
jgi:sugar phosphate isomerase/epimerase